MKDEDNVTTFIKPLASPILPGDIEREAKKIKKDNAKQDIKGGNRTKSFAMMVKVLSQLAPFQNPSLKHIAYLLYGDHTETGEYDESGLKRLQNQMWGRRSFIPTEQNFWFNVGLRTFGKNVMSNYTPTTFIRTPISTVMRRVKETDLAIQWDRLDPVVILQLLTMMGTEDRTPARLTISKVVNARPTSIHGNTNTRFVYAETKPRYKIGQTVNLLVQNLRPSEDFVVVEYAYTPYRQEHGNSEYQAQFMRYHYRNGAEVYAILEDFEQKQELALGEDGQLNGDHGFCIVTYPRTDSLEDGKDPFGLWNTDEYATVEEFKEFALKLRGAVFQNPLVSVNLTEFHLEK